MTADATDILVRIRGALPSLRPAERRVADVLIADPATAADSSIGVLARTCSTSETTVMRLCRSLGLNGYPDLRLSLARAASRQEARHGVGVELNAEIGASDSLAEIVNKIGFSDARAIEDTTATIDVSTLNRAAAAVQRAGRIDVYGIGASGFVCQDLHQKLHRIGMFASVWPDPHGALTSAALLGETDVAVGISHTGTTRATLDPMRLAGEQGATTIAITNDAASPLAACADFVLATAARETTFRSGATASRIAQLAVIDFLFVAIAQRSYDGTMRALESTYAAVHERRSPRP